MICIYLHSGNNCIKWARFFSHLPSFQTNSSGISPYSTLNENQNSWFRRAAMNPNNLVCLSTGMKMGTLFQSTLCSCHICIIRSRDFSQCKGRHYNGWCLWETWFAPCVQAHLLLRTQAGDDTGMPVQVQPALLLGPSRRRWGNPDEPLSGVTAAFQCSSSGSRGSHQLSMGVRMPQETCQSWEWLLWMLRAAQNPAPIGNANNECLKNIFMEIFFPGSLLGRNTSELLQRLFLHKMFNVLVFTSLPVGTAL